MYLRFPSLINKTGASASYDSNAQAYFNKGITDNTQKSAWNTFVLSAKATGYYSKFYYFHPFMGGNATKHSYDAINAGTTYDIVWSGTAATHNSNGVTSASGAIGSTGFNSGSFFTISSAHLGLYLNQAGLSAIDATLFDVSLSYNAIFFQSGDTGGYINGMATPTAILSSGLVVANLYDDTSNQYVEFYNNATLVSSTYMSTNTPATGTELKYFGSYLPSYGSTANIRAGWAAQSFTPAEMSSFYTHLQTFQTSLGRNL